MSNKTPGNIERVEPPWYMHGRTLFSESQKGWLTVDYVLSYCPCYSSFSIGKVARRSRSIATLTSTIEPLEQVLSNFNAFRALFLVSACKKRRKRLCKYLPAPLRLLFY